MSGCVCVCVCVWCCSWQCHKEGFHTSVWLNFFLLFTAAQTGEVPRYSHGVVQRRWPSATKTSERELKNLLMTSVLGNSRNLKVCEAPTSKKHAHHPRKKPLWNGLDPLTCMQTEMLSFSSFTQRVQSWEVVELTFTMPWLLRFCRCEFGEPHG